MNGDHTIADSHWRVIVSPDCGMLIRNAVDLASGASLLWEQGAPAPPGPFRELPRGGPESRKPFEDLFAGGWFPMFPSAGFTGELDGYATLFHGELNHLPWELLSQGRHWIEATVRTVRAPFELVRRVELAGGALLVETTVRNVGEKPASFTYGEHPCFLHETFAGGVLGLEVSEAWIPSPPFDPERSVLASGERFEWPWAPRLDGEPLDLSVLPESQDGRHDHACLALAGPRVFLTAPRFRRVLELELDLATTPYLLLWENLGQDGVFALEPSSAPGRGVDDAIEAGMVGRIAPGQSFDTRIALRLRDAA